MLVLLIVLYVSNWNWYLSHLCYNHCFHLQVSFVNFAIPPIQRTCQNRPWLIPTCTAQQLSWKVFSLTCSTSIILCITYLVWSCETTWNLCRLPAIITQWYWEQLYNSVSEDYKRNLIRRKHRETISNYRYRTFRAHSCGEHWVPSHVVSTECPVMWWALSDQSCG